MNINIQKILCPVDFSEPGRYAFDYACAVARRHSASLELLHVAQPSAYAEDELPPGEISYEESYRLQLQQLADEADCPAEVSMIAGIPYIEIINRAEHIRADMIVIGTHGRTGIKHFMIGSVAERVVRAAGCPVLTVRHPDFNVKQGE
ncbi:universal stress protein [Pontiellaceae bacterium B1224]|nr:universal stress protein [Pontiellaceae bacterium B1224]